MKKIVFVSALLLLCFSGITQDMGKKEVSGSFAFLNSSIFRFEELDGVGYFKDGSGWQVAVNYNYPVGRGLYVHSGLAYFQVQNQYRSPYIGPDNPIFEQMETTRMFCVPIGVKYYFTPWLFSRVAFKLDNQLLSDNNYLDNQSGIGFTIDAGLKLQFKDRYFVSFTPGIAFTSLLPFSMNDYQQHISIDFFTFHFGYQFD